MGDVEGGEIGADHRHHRVDGAFAGLRQPFRLGLILERRAEFAGQRLADRLEVVAGVEAIGDRADVLAQSLAVAEVRRAGQNVDLAAGVVDVIFARRLAAGKDQQAGEGVAEYRAPRMTDVHRPGRVGAHVFNVDRPLRAWRPGPEAHALGEDRPQNLVVDLRLQHDIDEARPRGLGAQHVRFAREVRSEAYGQGARVRAGLLGFPRIDHRRIGREIAVGRLPRRLDDEAAEIEAAGQCSASNPFLEQPGDARLKVGEYVHLVHAVDASAPEKRAPLSQLGGAVKKTGVLGDREPVGHAGDVVGDRPRALALAGLGGPVGRHRGRVGHVGLKQLPHDRVRPVPDLAHLRMAVHAGEEERLDVAVGGPDRGRPADEGLAGRRDRFGTVDLRLRDPSAALADRVLNEPRDDAPGELMDDARFFERLDRGRRSPAAILR